ncbi:kinase-like domain-containing protein [Syncephalastrum racemosum]|uniref:non-specific serine/threonine protein kinase n=1 Tax=Syncephalastrum racemosum TaxID=13706 RepID=A0A1X2HLS8_SYNRA|nr:kinase-like domain-containing protein [Syncephalastrum racemosum]
MGLFRSVLHPKEAKAGGSSRPSSLRSNSSGNEVSSSKSVHTIPAQHTPHTPPRFQYNQEDGTHTHYIKYAPGNRLVTSLHGIAGFLQRESGKAFNRLPLRAVAASDKNGKTTPTETPRSSDTCLSDKWGTCQEVIGRGAFGIVRIAHKTDPSGGKGERLYAVKEFRKKGSESNKQYVKRLTSEFCIASSLHHRNIVETLDLLPLSESSSAYCEVMEYCNGSDLFNLICDYASNGLEVPEANCFFKQMVRGVAYMHSLGIAHRDLKPENLLLTVDGCLKISDFGGAECFRPAHQPDVLHYCKGVCGSEPYISPEEYGSQEYDPRLVDVWSCAIVYMAMRTGNHLWQVARKGDDDNYDRYLKFRRLVEEERENAIRERREKYLNQQPNEKEAGIQKARDAIRKRAKECGIDIFEGLEFGAKKLIYRMLDPNPQKRIQINQVMENDWFSRVYCCKSA